MTSRASRPWKNDLVEIALIFAVFFVQGAWPVPDVNEPYYLGKAIHYWNPDWVQGDFFLDSADAHGVFYFAFGWLGLLVSPPVMAWVGRVLTWGLLAWSWQRLSWAVVPRRGMAVLFISHDLAVVAELCDRVAVMRAGQLVELGPTSQVLTSPVHAYTRELIDSIPRLESLAQ